MACKMFYLKITKILQTQKYVFEDHKHFKRDIGKNWNNDVKIDCLIGFARHKNIKKSIKQSITSNSKVFLQRLIICSLCDKKNYFLRRNIVLAQISQQKTSAITLITIAMLLDLYFHKNLVFFLT